MNRKSCHAYSSGLFIARSTSCGVPPGSGIGCCATTATVPTVRRRIEKNEKPTLPSRIILQPSHWFSLWYHNAGLRQLKVRVLFRQPSSGRRPLKVPRCDLPLTAGVSGYRKGDRLRVKGERFGIYFAG